MDDLRDLGVEDGFSADGLSLRWEPTHAVASLRYFDPADPFAVEVGGVLGGLLGIIAYFRHRHLSIGPYWDALALGTAPAWAIARVGCAVVVEAMRRLASALRPAWTRPARSPAATMRS